MTNVIRKTWAWLWADVRVTRWLAVGLWLNVTYAAIRGSAIRRGGPPALAVVAALLLAAYGDSRHRRGLS